MNDIKAGDLVMVVRAKPCCGSCNDLGAVRKVLAIDNHPGKCLECGTVYVSRDAVYRIDHNGSECWAYDTARLIRIDPPAQPESVETDREVVA